MANGEVEDVRADVVESVAVGPTKAILTKTFQLAGNRDGEILDFVISECEDDVSFSLGGKDLPDWFIGVIWGLILGFRDPVWIRLLVYWAKRSGVMNSSFLGNPALVEEIMDYLPL